MINSPEQILKKYLENNGIKLIFVAERSNISPVILSRSLDGKRKLRADEFVSICQVLNLDFKDFRVEQKGA